MTSLSSQDLMAICDRHWIPGKTIGYGDFVAAYNELATRGPEIRDWCRGLLTHPDYDARGCGAFLLGQLGKRRQLGEAEAAVVKELGALTQRPVEDDCKELEAVDTAITALTDIGHPAGIPFLRAVLCSDDEWLSGDSQWEAAHSLARLVGEPFEETPDPVAAALAWLSIHPD